MMPTSEIDAACNALSEQMRLLDTVKKPAIGLPQRLGALYGASNTLAQKLADWQNNTIRYVNALAVAETHREALEKAQSAYDELPTDERLYERRRCQGRYDNALSYVPSKPAIPQHAITHYEACCEQIREDWKRYAAQHQEVAVVIQQALDVLFTLRLAFERPPAVKDFGTHEPELSPQARAFAVMEASEEHRRRA